MQTRQDRSLHDGDLVCICPQYFSELMPSNADYFDYDAALEACAKGERFAFRALYERESRWLLGVAMRIVRDRDLAHDVLQEAFLQIWQRAETFERDLGSGRGWIYTVVRHRALDAVRSAGREQPLGDDIDLLAEQAAPDDEAHAGHDEQALDRCLSLLDEPKRQCVIEAYVQGYTHEQIATRLDKPIGTVKSWVRRGLLALKECLS